MKREEITFEKVKQIGDAVREFNRNKTHAVTVHIVDGEQQPLSDSQQASCDASWYAAIQYGLEQAAD